MTNPKARLDDSATCHVLREDPCLAQRIPAGRRARAEDACIARTLTISRGRWSDRPAGGCHDGIGLLVLEGLLLRRVDVGGRFGAELLGAGDLLRPWEDDDPEPMLRRATAWRTLETARLAVLDDGVMRCLVRYPPVIERLVARGLERSRRLAVNMAIVHQPRVETRVHMMFWHLAERWGHAERGRMRLPLRLTHTVVADLTAARRPTVSTALSDLARRRMVCRVENGWLLAGEPPPAVIELAGPAELLSAER